MNDADSDKVAVDEFIDDVRGALACGLSEITLLLEGDDWQEMEPVTDPAQIERLGRVRQVIENAQGELP